MRETAWKRLEIGGADRASTEPISGNALETDGTCREVQGKQKRSRDSKWGAWYRRCLDPDEQNDGDRECFWNRRAGVVTGKSQFNKEKWLPLVYTPFLISHYCCAKMKKAPMHKYQRDNGYKPILATLAEESRVRKQGWIRHGCNAFDSQDPKSQPMSFWTEQDVLRYILEENLRICSIYGEIVPMDADGQCRMEGGNLRCTGCQRQGCFGCAYGLQMDTKGESRFMRLARTHPKQYAYCIGGGAYDPEDGYWKPTKEGLGMGHVFDEINRLIPTKTGRPYLRYLPEGGEMERAKALAEAKGDHVHVWGEDYLP